MSKKSNLEHGRPKKKDQKAEARRRSRKRRNRVTRGLPSDVALRELARTYLELQHRLWPEFVHAGNLPGLTDQNVHALADDFKRRFLGQHREE